MKEQFPVEAVIFDLGGVVFGISLEAIIKSWAESADVSPQDIAAKFGPDLYYERFETSDISPEEYRDHVCEVLGISLSDEDFDRGWNSIYLDVLPGIEPLLKKLRNMLRLVVLTNTNEVHAGEWRKRYSEILRYFERIFASHEIGARKPEPASFQTVLGYLGLAPEKVVFIDDNPENVSAANALGIISFTATTAGEITEKLKQIGMEIR